MSIFVCLKGYQFLTDRLIKIKSENVGDSMSNFSSE
jgi:hypothetical protein